MPERSRLICGIAGFSLSVHEEKVNANTIAKHMLCAIEHRGFDASGAAWRVGDSVIVQKAPLAASDFVPRLSVYRRATSAILHTRAWTQGEPTDNNNNHPISTGGVVGVHNGGVVNDYELFKTLPNVERIAEVDSEAIFALIAHGAENIPQVDHVTDLLEFVEGTAAIAWMDQADGSDTLHLARLSYSPLCVGQTKAGSLFFGSTKESVFTGAECVGLSIDFYYEPKTGTYLRVIGGRIVEQREFYPVYATKWQHQAAYSSHSTGGVKTRTSKSFRDYDSEDETWCDKCQVFYCTEHYFVSVSDEVERVVAAAKTADTFRGRTLGTKPPTALIDASYLSGDVFIERHDSEDHEFLYRERILAVEEAVAAETTLTDGEVLETVRAAHAFLREGDWVRTTLGDYTNPVYGQVVRMPQTWPEGEYIIRLLLWNGARHDGDSEYVLVGRTWDRFEPVTKQVNHHHLPAVRESVGA